jgi:hypothetical protein
VEVMWLLGKLALNHKTIADFRKDNLTAFKDLFKAFCLLCRGLELFGSELVAIDPHLRWGRCGSKFKAVNSSKRNFTQTKVQAYLAEMETRLEAYLQELDQVDQAEASAVPPRRSAAYCARVFTPSVEGSG